jgi:PAS domain-containing protein
MVSVASSQIASIGIPAYRAASNDGGAPPLDAGKAEDQTSPVQAAFDRLEAAVQLSLSSAALDHLAAANRMSERLGITLKDGQSPEEAAQQYFDDKSRQGKLSVEIGMLNSDISRQARAKDDLRQNQDEYNRILKTKPVPRKELSGMEKDAAIKLLENLGYARPGKNQTRMFSVDGTMYMFKGDDGSVWSNDGYIPISEEAKQLSLGHLSNRISEGQRDMGDVISNRDALQAQYDALAAKYTPRAEQE